MSGLFPGFQRQMPSVLPIQRTCGARWHSTFPVTQETIALSNIAGLFARLTQRTRIAINPTDTHPQAAVTILNEWTRPTRASGVSKNMTISDSRKTSICAHIERSVTRSEKVPEGDAGKRLAGERRPFRESHAVKAIQAILCTNPDVPIRRLSDRLRRTHQAVIARAPRPMGELRHPCRRFDRVCPGERNQQQDKAVATRAS